MNKAFTDFKISLAKELQDNDDDYTADLILKSSDIKAVANNMTDYIMAGEDYQETWEYILEEHGGMEFNQPYETLVDGFDDEY